MSYCFSHAVPCAQISDGILSSDRRCEHRIFDHFYDTPSQLFVPAVVTAENLKAEIIDKGIVAGDVLCVDRYVDGCKALGITQ